MSIPFYDAHNHLQDARLAADRIRIIADCRAVGIKGMVVNGTCENDWPKVLDLARQHRSILPSFGCHPWYLDRRTPDWEDELKRHLDAVPAAVGEIGLDRRMKDFNSDLQAEMFCLQLGIAAERNLPVTIHCLKAWGQLINLLESNPLPKRGFLLHSYSGSAEMVHRFAELGAYFSISGYFAHERKAKQLEVFRLIPSDRLLIETDAPDMAPPEPLIDFPIPNSSPEQPLNHPANLRSIYHFTGSLLDVTNEAIAIRVAENFNRLFGSSDGG